MVKHEPEDLPPSDAAGPQTGQEEDSLVSSATSKPANNRVPLRTCPHPSMSVDASTSQLLFLLGRRIEVSKLLFSR